MNNEELLKLNNLVREYSDKYLNLNVLGKNISVPYFLNKVQPFYSKLMRKAEIPEEQITKVNKMFKNKEIPYAWYRGKGTPEQIIEAAVEISKDVQLNFEYSSAQTVVDFMKLYGIGLDCSGYVFNSLAYAFEQIGQKELFLNSLDWAENENPEKQTVNYAGAFTFAGKASEIIDSNNLQPLDLLLIGEEGDYWHIGIFLKNGDEWFLAESSLDLPPSGLHLNLCTVKDGHIHFKDRERLAHRPKEFRRLKCLL